jgi:hypothetical protein
MKKISLSIISTLILLTGCATGGGETSTNPPIPPQPTPTPIPETPKNNINNNISTTSGLIPSTNPSDRLQQVSQGRNDPFDTITPPAVIKVKNDQILTESAISSKAIIKQSPEVVNEKDSVMAKSGNESLRNVSKNNIRNTDVGNNQNNGVNKPNNLSSSPSPINSLPPSLPPSPNDAKNIILSGILDLQGETIALIQTPWDSVTRSVRIGDVITDNKGIRVRVKDINFGYPTTIALQENNQIVLRSINNNNGIVVLEQFGQNVTRKMGETNKDSLAKL